MKVLHLAASLPNPAMQQPPRINPLRPVTAPTPLEEEETDIFMNHISIETIEREELEKFIKSEFEPFFSKFSKMTKMVEKAYISLEESEGFTPSVRSLSSALENLESLVSAKANEFLSYALQQMPTLLVSEIFTEVCENPYLCLESDMLF